MKFYQSGRSMVEMLGVLAIIGVLSVGAIAGYSKAMFKYRLNKAMEQYNQIISAATINQNILLDATSYSGDYLSLLAKMNEVDPEIVKNGYAYDVFGNNIRLNKNGSYLDCTITLGTNGAHIGNNHELCRALYSQIFTARPNDFYRISIAVGAWSETTTGSYKHQIFGKTCSANQTCLKDLTLAEINDICHSCEEGKLCRIEVLW